MFRCAAFLLALVPPCIVLPSTALAQVPTIQRATAPDFHEATFLGVTSCRPDPVFEYCTKGIDRVYTIMVDGKPYVLRSGPTESQLLSMIGNLVAPENRSSMASRNLLEHMTPNSEVEVRFHGSAVDVRALAPSGRGTPRYEASHYLLALSQMDRLYHRGPDRPE
jgi:hypothetical protein